MADVIPSIVLLRVLDWLETAKLRYCFVAFALFGLLSYAALRWPGGLAPFYALGFIICLWYMLMECSRRNKTMTPRIIAGSALMLLVFVSFKCITRAAIVQRERSFV